MCESSLLLHCEGSQLTCLQVQYLVGLKKIRRRSQLHLHKNATIFVLNTVVYSYWEKTG